MGRSNKRKNANKKLAKQNPVKKEQNKFKAAKQKLLGVKRKQPQVKNVQENTSKVEEWVNETAKLSPKAKKKGTKAGLWERMMERLQGAQFRFINEQLYTAEGDKSNKMFCKNPDAFKAYHTGFQQQVQQWEFNPLDTIIANIKKKDSKLVVADFGCGDARLAQSVPNKVHSFDLVALNEHVTACDMAHTPLSDSSVDIAVFCLSLMGTNLSDFILEAKRVLKEGGMLKIAEVESRFDGEKGLSSFMHNVTKYGFKLASKNLAKTFFYFMDFKKTTPEDSPKKLPKLILKPCVYKKR